MFALNSHLNFKLYTSPTDMRKSFDSLSGLVTNQLKENPINGDVYIFINKQNNKIKLLHWSGNGFVLYYKRLEEGTFSIPKYEISSGKITLDYTQLVMLIDGISITNLDRKNPKNIFNKSS